MSRTFRSNVLPLLPIHAPHLHLGSDLNRDERRAEVEKSTSPFSMRDLERVKEDLVDLSRYSEKYFQEREALMIELEEVITELLSYGSVTR
jgi:hypothetical protein